MVIPSGIVTTGWPAVQAKAAELGIFYDPWQNSAGSIALGKRKDGKYAATIGGITWSIPRQVGKTFLVGSLLMVLCVLFPGLKVVWTAHRTRTITNTFRALQGLARRRKFSPLVRYIRTANGEQEIGFTNGSIIMFGAREQGFGRGFDVVDVEVFDEAQILTEKALEDMVAATNQAQHPHGALLFYMGTPPRPVDPGEAFTAKRRKALSGKSADMVYIEFSADDNAGLDDRTQWAKANPSYPTRTPLESMLRLRENLLSDDAWRREALGIWDEASLTFRPVTLDAWRATAEDVRPDGSPVFFVTIAKEMRSATINVAALNGDRPHVELADHRPGTMWLTDRVRELRERWPGAKFGSYLAGPVKAWGPTFAEFGVELEMLSQPQASSAFAHLQKLCEDLSFTHSDNSVFVESLRGLETRDLEGGGWLPDWRNSTADPAPIAGAAGALWLLESTPPTPFFASRR